MSISRRQFMVGCSAAVAAMAGGRISNLVFADSVEAAPNPNGEILVVVFLRGGIDGLNLVTPFDDPRYVAARGGLRVPDTGDHRAITLATSNTTFTSSLGLHPSAAPLKELYDQKNMAIVHACGLTDDTRSHFDAMDYMERGTPGIKSTPSGWIARHLRAAGAGGQVPSLAAGSATPASLLSDSRAVATNNPGGFQINSAWRYTRKEEGNQMLKALKRIYSGNSAMQLAGMRTIETIELLQERELSTPDVEYMNQSFHNSLKLVAQMIKLNVGLQVATVDFGGWDTHENQGNDGQGYFANQVDVLSRGLHAFFNDLPNQRSRLTVLVMSEFGRRLGANVSGGTDHGHGNVMLALGGNVNGGKVYGRWPGLVDLDQSQDLKITTDYRTVVSEILVRRLGNPKLGSVFPGITEQEYSSQRALNIVRGTDLPIDYTAASFNVSLPMVTR